MSAVVPRRAAPDDVADIARIARITWPDTYSGLIPEADQRAFLDRAYAPASLARAIEREDRWFFVAELDGAVIGFAEFGPGALPGASEDGGLDIELFRIYVHPGAQRAGAGSALLAAGVDAIREARPSARRLFLRVEDGNEKGMRFYARHGFRSRPAEPIVVGASRCCALVYERPL